MLFFTDGEDLNTKLVKDERGEILGVRLGDLIPDEIWEMGIEAVQVGRSAAMREPTKDEIVTRPGNTRGYTIWIGDGIRWIIGCADEYDGVSGYWYDVSWTMHPQIPPTRPPIPG